MQTIHSFFKHYSFTSCLLMFAFSLSGQLTFTDATEELGIQHVYDPLGFMGSGVSCFDYNNDHYMDLYFTGGYSDDKLFRNNGDGTFTDVSAVSGISHIDTTLTIGVVTGDLDNDGFRDIFVSTRSATPSILWKNNGDGTFTDISIASGINRTSDGITEQKQSFSATMGDFNLDGYLDIYMVNWIDTLGYLYDTEDNLFGFEHQCAPNRLYLNNGDMTFTEVADVLGVKDLGCGLATTFSDYDNDSDMDILIANDFGEWVIPDALYQNNFPQNSFTNLSESSGFDSQLYGMGIGVGDYDQDGDLDYYKTNIGRNVLLNNQGDGTFIDTTQFAGVEDHYIDGIAPFLSIGWGAGFVDFDHDTYLDLFVANGRVGSPQFFPSRDSMPDRLFKNNGEGTFSDVTIEEGLVSYGLSRGFSYGDLDNDGDVEMIFTCVPNVSLGIPASPVVFKNNLNNDKNWLKVKLRGTVNNRDALGSHILIYVDGKSWVHEIGGGGQGHNSQHSSIAHFGLGNAAVVDSLIVNWPGGNTPDQVFYNIEANRMIEIIEGEDDFIFIHGLVATAQPVAQATQVKLFPNPSSNLLNIELDLYEPSDVQINLLTIGGRPIATISNNFKNAGHHKITSQVNQNAGVYLLQVIANDTSIVKKVIIVHQ